MEIWIPIIISLFALIWSIIQSNQQQKLANQHHLWDRRIKQYRVLQSIMHAYKEHRSLLWSHNELQKDIAEAADQLYGWMSSCDVVRSQVLLSTQTVEHQHIATQDFLYDCIEQNKILWDSAIANMAAQMIESYAMLLNSLYYQSKFNHIEDEMATKWRIPLNIVQQRKYQQAEKKLYSHAKKCEEVYTKCLQLQVLELMSSELKLSSTQNWLKNLINCFKRPPEKNPVSMDLETQSRMIDIHDKRLSQLFKVCYIAAPGFASALLAHSTLTDNADIVAKYTIPAIITATAAVVLWIITHALSAGRCFDYSAPQWNNYINHSNETYQHTLDMIKCALIWIFTVFIVSTLAQHQQPNVVSAIKILDSTCSPITTGILFLNLAVVRWAAKHVIGYQCLNTILTYLTYGCGLLWTTHVIWML